MRCIARPALVSWKGDPALPPDCASAGEATATNNNPTMSRVRDVCMSALLAEYS
jgi:hypothetical protein